MIPTKKDEKIISSFEPNDDSDVINKCFFNKKLGKVNCHLSILEIDYNELKLITNKQSNEEVFVQRAVKTTIQTVYDKGSFDSFPNANKVLKKYLFVTRRRADLEEENDDIQ